MMCVFTSSTEWKDAPGVINIPKSDPSVRITTNQKSYNNPSVSQNPILYSVFDSVKDSYVTAEVRAEQMSGL